MSCREERPIVHELEQTYGDRVAFVHVNILNPDSLPIMKQYGFSASPELYLVDPRGKVIGFWDDVQSKAELASALNKALK